MNRKFNGFSKNTAKKLVLDAGAFCVNYDKTKSWADNKAAGAVICATQGGGGFSATPTYRQINVDGIPSHWKGGEQLEDYNATLNIKMVEHDATLAKQALGVADVGDNATIDGVTYNTVVPHYDVEDTDYITNVAWCGKIRGSEAPVIIILYNALALNGISWNFADAAELVTDCTFTAHFDLDSDGQADQFFEILYPTV